MYAPIGIPMLLIGILYFVCFGYKLLTQNQNEAVQNLEEQKDFSNVPKWKQIISLVVLIVVIFAMIFEEFNWNQHSAFLRSGCTLFGADRGSDRKRSVEFH